MFVCAIEWKIATIGIHELGTCVGDGRCYPCGLESVNNISARQPLQFRLETVAELRATRHGSGVLGKPGELWDTDGIMDEL